MFKLTLGKTLALNDVLYVPEIRANLISVSLPGMTVVKFSFEFDKIVMTKNNVLIGKGYCNQGLFLFSVAEMNNDASSSASLIDSFDLWHGRLGHASKVILLDYKKLK